MSSEKILIIEDEEPISELIKLTLESGGFSNIITAFDGETGLAAARARGLVWVWCLAWAPAQESARALALDWALGLARDPALDLAGD